MIKSLKDELQFRWDSFDYNFAWPDFASYINGPAAKAAALFPVVGYLILFNDTISNHLTFEDLTDNQVLYGGLSSALRLQCLYFGLLSLGISNVIYMLRRPRVMKFGENSLDYINVGIHNFDVGFYLDAKGEIRRDGHLTMGGKFYDADFDNFMETARGNSTMDGDIVRSADWASAKNKYEHLLRGILMDYYFRRTIERRLSLTGCIAVSTAGYFLLLIPSLDLFIKVLAAIYGSYL